ncbi:MAG: hypothetical protein ACI9K4_000966 [Polaribacter sp.]|jgi:hypothetical protein
MDYEKSNRLKKQANYLQQSSHKLFINLNLLQRKVAFFLSNSIYLFES